MEYFLDPTNTSIWAQVQTLAQKGDDAGLAAHVAEAQRLTSTQRNVRIATQPVTLEGKSIQPGTAVVLLLGAAGRNPAEVESAAEFNPARKLGDAVTPFSHGKHQCLGRHIARAYLNGMVKLVAGLKNLRPAPGEMGKVKTIRVGADKAYLNDSWSYLTFDASSKFPAVLLPSDAGLLLTARAPPHL